ncbi:MAG: hypothetical protein AB7S78_00215 [Candidatus Omnitrophota bacterium]
MLFSITLLTSLLFSFTYPLVFWISAKEPLKNNFHRFHIGLPTVTGVITLIFVIRMALSPLLTTLSIIWIFGSLALTGYYWNKETVNLVYVTVLSILGLCITGYVQTALTGFGYAALAVSILGGLIFSSSLYAMNLGHWYLNVHGLPLKHLRSAMYLFWGLVLTRFLWDLFYIFSNHVMYQGDLIRVFDFIRTMEGFLLLIPFFFGTVLPLFALFMVHEILKLKNTQAATGILYVILCGVVLGDMAYKYYFIKFGILL